MRTALSSSCRGGAEPDPLQLPPWVWACIWSPSISPLGVGLDLVPLNFPLGCGHLIPLNFPLGCGPGPNPLQFPLYVWAWTWSPSTSPKGVGLKTPLGQTLLGPGTPPVQGMLGYHHPPLQGMLGCHLQCMLGYHHHPPPRPVNRMTDACENITFPQLRCGR